MVHRLLCALVRALQAGDANLGAGRFRNEGLGCKVRDTPLLLSLPLFLYFAPTDRRMTHAPNPAQKRRPRRFGKVDADAETEIAERFRIKAYPTFKILDGGKSEDYTGDHQKESFIRFAKVQALLNPLALLLSL